MLQKDVLIYVTALPAFINNLTFFFDELMNSFS